MHRISYPTDVTELNEFLDVYYSVLKKNRLNAINNHLSNLKIIGLSIPLPLTFESLVKLKFEELLLLEPEIKKYSDSKIRIVKMPNGKVKRVNDFADLFDYKSNQQKLAYFFMDQKKIELKCCNYCGIDFINAFKNIGDYQTELEFVNYADKFDLQFIKGIDQTIADTIIKKRQTAKYTSINQIPAKSSIIREIKRFDFKNSHNHFTLDHLIPQSTHNFYSLCLYNLVPCCYSCNSKFKNKIEFALNSKLELISPTSDKHSLNDDFQFGIFFSGKIDNIKSETNFQLIKKVSNNTDHINNYFRMFKILGRYIYHKDQILRLIERKIKYPESKIKELSKQTGMSKQELRKLIFGEELFEQKLSNQQFIKFRRDIAKNIGIRNVL